MEKGSIQMDSQQHIGHFLLELDCTSRILALEDLSLFGSTIVVRSLEDGRWIYRRVPPERLVLRDKALEKFVIRDE
jgi:hypothetical protein